VTYRLEFHTQALKEWKRLGAPVRDQFRKKLAERLEQPHVPASRLRGVANRYKIKLRAGGFRLVYEVRDQVLVVAVIAVGKRERGRVYGAAKKR